MSARPGWHLPAVAVPDGADRGGLWRHAAGVSQRLVERSNAAHGLLVPPLVACIAWQRRGLILAIPAKPDLKGLAVTFGACAVLIIGKLGAEFFLSRISFVLLLAGMVYTFWGVKRLRALSFPFVLLSTMVRFPCWYTIPQPCRFNCLRLTLRPPLPKPWVSRSTRKAM